MEILAMIVCGLILIYAALISLLYWHTRKLVCLANKRVLEATALLKYTHDQCGKLIIQIAELRAERSGDHYTLN